MRPSRTRGIPTLVAALLVAALLAACPADDPSAGDSGTADLPERGSPEPGEARVVRLAGEVTVRNRDAVSRGDTFGGGAEIRLGKDAVLELGFSDGASLVVSGRAGLRLSLLRAGARRIDLAEGRIGWFRVGDTVTGVHTPTGAFVAARESTIAVEVSNDRTTFELLEGNDAKVVHGKEVRELEAGAAFEVPRTR